MRTFLAAIMIVQSTLTLAAEMEMLDVSKDALVMDRIATLYKYTDVAKGDHLGVSYDPKKDVKNYKLHQEKVTKAVAHYQAEPEWTNCMAGSVYLDHNDQLNADAPRWHAYMFTKIYCEKSTGSSKVSNANQKEQSPGKTGQNPAPKKKTSVQSK